jgi:hypothetical protein
MLASKSRFQLVGRGESGRTSMKLLDFDLGDQTSHVQLAASYPGREASRLEAYDMHH